MCSLENIQEKVGFVGSGNMASALVRSLVRAGFDPKKLCVTDLQRDLADGLARELGVAVAETAADLVAVSDVIVVAVKPKVVGELLSNLPVMARLPLWVSVAAGVPTERIEMSLGSGARVIRAMPNTPALVGAGATALCRGTHATTEDLTLAEALLGAGGLTVQVEESMMDAVTGLSGSGPAFVMMIIEGLADGGVRAGLPRAVAQRLAVQTVLGSARLVLETGKHPAELKDAVASPGGTTIAGIAALEEAGLRAGLIGAVMAATRRSKELSQE